MTAYLINDDTLTDIADAIRTKTGGSSSITPLNMPTEILSIPSGGSPVLDQLSVTANGTYTPPSGTDGYDEVVVNVSGGSAPSADDDVVFFDYDGTVLYSYSKSDFLALLSMPPLPDHTNIELTADDWNWSLVNAQNYLSSNGYNMPILCVGAIYHYSGTDTKLVIELIGNNSPYLSLDVNGTVTIDWGDETTTDTITGSSVTSYQRTLHEYSNNGTYTITITPASGTTYSLGNSNNRIIMSKASGNKNDSDLSYMNILKKLWIGSGVTRLHSSSFRDNFGLKEVYFGSDVTAVESDTFNKCLVLDKVVLNEGLTSFDSNNHFAWCNKLKYISIPRTVTKIPSITDCRSLEYISISDSVTSTGETYSIARCYKLNKITFPSTINGFVNYMFRDCYGLKYIMSPNYPKIWHDCFEGCSSFSLNALEDNKVIEPDTFDKIQGSDHYYNCNSLEQIELSSNRTEIPSAEFKFCYSLKEIDLSNITTIGSDAFNTCQSLTNVTFGNNLTTIGGSAFYGCRALNKVEIPENVTSIGAQAFRDCTGLTEVKFTSTTPPTISNSNCWTNLPTTCKIYVPSGTLADYTSASNYPSSSTYTYVEY